MLAKCVRACRIRPYRWMIGCSVASSSSSSMTTVFSPASLRSPLQIGIVSAVVKAHGVSNSKTTTHQPMTFHVRRHLQPFAEGGTRIAFRAEMAMKKTALGTSKSAVILKTFKYHGRGIGNRNHYFNLMEMSSIARRFADAYNKSTDRPPGCADIKILPVAVIERIRNDDCDGGNEAPTSRYFGVKSPLPTKGTAFTRFCNNTGYWDMDYVDKSLLLFCRYTFFASGEYLMVTDLQGVKVGNTYYLTDPAILCTDLGRFGQTNLGSLAIEKCMNAVNTRLHELEEQERNRA
mmetsp:Transcript_13998/g.39863  ORF Transcript_13998/g.39863 Transcript_13998/m.39863 type:complete len:291 (-) Transcript_13998:83-955(-)